MNDDLAPASAVGITQIIPSTGPHTQFYPDEDRLRVLLLTGWIEYTPEYGPNARVYRPIATVNEDVVRTWMEMDFHELGKAVADGEERAGSSTGVSL